MELLTHAYQEEEARGPDGPPPWGPGGESPQSKGYGGRRLEYFVNVVAEFALCDGPGAFVVSLESGNLAPEDGGIGITIAVVKKVREG